MGLVDGNAVVIGARGACEVSRVCVGGNDEDWRRVMVLGGCYVLAGTMPYSKVSLYRTESPGQKSK